MSKLIEIDAPDGTVVEFPAGTSSAVIKSAMAKRYGGPAPAPSLMKQVGMAAADNGAALVENMAALPDLAASGFGKIAGGVMRLFGADRVASSLENPFTIGGAVRSAVPEVAGNALPRAIVGSVGGLAGGVGIGQAVRGLNSVAQGVATSLASAPRAQIVGGAAANLAAIAAKEAGAPIPVQMGAAFLAGGVTPSVADAGFAGLRRAASPLIPGYTRETAARILKDNVIGDPDAVAARISAATARPAVSGAKPTTAEVAGDYVLPGFQRSLQTNSKAGGMISQRMADNAALRLRASNRAMGPGDVTRLSDEATAVAASNARMLDARRGAVGLYEPAEVTGEAVRGALTDAAAVAKSRASRLYDMPGGDEPVQVGAIDTIDAMPRTDGPPVGAFRRNVMDTLAERVPDAEMAGRRAQGGTLAGMLKGQVHPDSSLGRELSNAGYGPQQRPDLFNRRANPRMGLDLVIQRARERGFVPEAPSNSPDMYGENDFLEALLSDVAATGKGAAGQRAMTVEGQVSRAEMQARQQNQDYVQQMLDERKLNPATMQAEEWDALYRDVNNLPERSVTRADMEFLSDGADVAQGVAKLSPFQASLIDLQRQFFPAGLPAKSGVSALIRQLTNADVMQTKQIERVIRDLRAQSGMLRGGDGISAALAKSAANAAEGFLSSQAGQARMEAMRRARAGWRGYSSTFREGEPGKALATNQFGTPTLDAARVPAALVPAGRTGATAARRLQTAVGAEQAESVARSELRRALEGAGNDPVRIAAVGERYADTLRAYPGLAGDVTAARETAALADAFTRSPLARVGADGDPVAAVGRMLRAQDGGRNLRVLAGQVRGSPQAAAGLRRALAGHIEAASTSRSGVNADGADLVNNNGLRGALNDVLAKTAMTDLLSREQRRVLLNVRRETKGAQFAATANKTPGSDTARNADVFGRMFAAVIANGVGGGVGGKIKTVLEFAIAVAGRADAVRELTVEAMLDPKLAAELLKAPTPDRLRSLAERRGGYLRSATVGAYSAESM